jgi:small-conductance mechanosensitive channel
VYVFQGGLAPLAAFIGVVGLAASLALQQVLQNLVAGVYLLAEQPFRIGDYIAVVGPAGANHEGTVEDIQMRTTHLRDRHDELIMVPNSAIFSGVVTNRTAVGGYVTTVSLTFPRDSDPGEVRHRVSDVLTGLGSILPTPKPELQVDKVDKEEWTASLLFWTLPHAAPSDALWAIGRAFPEATINAGGAA